MYGLRDGLVILLIISVGICSANNSANNSTCPGTLYKLEVVEDTWLELHTSSVTNNNQEYVIVGKHINYPKKRSLLKFEDIPSACTTVNHAVMYLYFTYASKPTSIPNDEALAACRTIVQAHRVLKSWTETGATSSVRYPGAPWQSTYLGLDDTDANDCPSGRTAIYAYRDPGFVEMDVTSAVKDWTAGKPNYGLVMWATNEDRDTRDIRFLSKTHSDSSKHAYLRIYCN